MLQHPSYDAVVIGSGPNGLSAAIALAQMGRSVVVLERAETLGGGARSAELTLPGFVHDSCSAIMPLAVASPFLSSLPLSDFGLEWIYSPSVVAHPLDDGRAIMIDQSLECTAERLGADGAAYRALVQPILDDWNNFRHDLLGPLPLPPRSMLTYIRFGLNALASATGLALSRFESEATRGMFAGLAGHSQLDLDKAASGAVGLVIALTAHAVGWPLPRGGAQSFSGALAAYLKSLGGEIVTGIEVQRMEDLPEHRVPIFNVSPPRFDRHSG